MAGDKGQNLVAIQILRCVAATLVVLFHSELAIRGFRLAYWAPGDDAFRAASYPFWANHLSVGVDIFFCISGFIMCMLAARADASQAFGFLRDRAVRILPPYWFFTLPIILIWLAKPGSHIEGLSGNVVEDLPRVLRSLILLPQLQPPILGPGWTLVQEASFYVFVSAIILAGHGRRMVVVTGVAALAGTVLWLRGTKVWDGYVLSPFYVEFFAGALTFHLYRRTSTLWPELQVILASALYLVVSAILDRHILEPLHLVIQAIGFGALGMLLISGVIGLYGRYGAAHGRACRALARIGDASYTLYLSHWFVLALLGKIAGLVSGLPLPLVVCWHAMSIAIAIGSAVVFAEKVELPLHRRLSRALKSVPIGRPRDVPSTSGQIRSGRSIRTSTL